MVSVEPIRSPEHREKEKNIVIGLESQEKTFKLVPMNVSNAELIELPCTWMMNLLNSREIAADDLVRWSKEECKDEPSDHQDEESDIRSIVDSVVRRVPVLADRNGRSDDAAKVENSPEVADVSTLLPLGGIGHHNSSLCSPKEGSTNTENRTSCDDEPMVLVVIVGEEGRGV